MEGFLVTTHVDRYIAAVDNYLLVALRLSATQTSVRAPLSLLGIAVRQPNYPSPLLRVL